LKTAQLFKEPLVAQTGEDGRIVQVLTKSKDKYLGWSVDVFFVAVDDNIGAEQQVRKEYGLGPEANVSTLTKLAANNVQALALLPGRVVRA
jgi:hypothetical protein